MLAFQRRFAAQPRGAVLDGRDIGTVICPTRRGEALHHRQRPRSAPGAVTANSSAAASPPTTTIILADIRRRDARDMTRSAAPLKPAEDAIILDTTALDAEAAFRTALDCVEAARRRA